MELSKPANPNTFSARLVTRIGRKLRSDKKYTQAEVEKQNQKANSKLRKKNPNQSAPAKEFNELGERNEYAIFEETATMANSKRTDHGEMMHGLAHHGSFDSLLDHAKNYQDPYAPTVLRRKRQGMLVSPEHEDRVASLPDELWKSIALYLRPIDAVSLAMSNKTLSRKLGLMPFEMLHHPENRDHKHEFLHAMDDRYPGHLLCYPCGKFHKRVQPGKEMLKIDYVNNPIFVCPNVKASVLPRMRITYGRELPYAYVQLALRATKHDPSYGIDYEKLSRRWKCKDSGWTHRTRYLAHDGRLLMRVVSQHFAPPANELTETAERHILYDREEYIPFFSVCAHWRDGDLMKICKCMMSHVPAPPDPYHKQLQRGFKVSKTAAKPDFIVRGCDECRPARRCPECPTEYLVEVQMIEDTTDKVRPFKHAIVVTRWSDLGDGSSPYTSPEWTAINGQTAGLEGKAYDSFTTIGRRAVGGVFESAVSGAIPGQRLISLNPKNKKMGEDGHGWY